MNEKKFDCFLIVICILMFVNSCGNEEDNYYDYSSYKSSYSSSYGNYNTKANKNKNSSSSSSTYSSSFYGSYDFYDKGYEDVYENEDWDYYLYENDEEYREGVDDALDELGW